MVQIVGTYECERSENLDPLKLKLGMFYVERILVCTRSPTSKAKMTKTEEERWIFKTVYDTKTLENNFKLDEEYEEELLDGKRLKSITTRETDNIFLTKSKGVEEEDDDVVFERHREFTEDGMIMTLQSPQEPDLVAKCYYKRLPSPEKSD